MYHTYSSRLFRERRQETHEQQVMASTSVLIWYYQRYPLPIVERHMPRIIRALVAAAVPH